MITLDIATAPHTNSKHWQQGTITWEQLAEWVKKPADHKECGGYVLGELRGGVRTRATVISRCAATLDADTAEAALPVDVAVLGYRALIHTTWSHTSDAPHYRIIILLSRPVTPEEYRRVVAVLMQRLGAKQFDPGSAEPERYMFMPSAQKPEWFQSWVIDGEPLDVDALLAESSSSGPGEVQERPSAPDPDLATAPTPQELEKAQAVLEKAVREVELSDGRRNNTASRWLLPLYNFVKGGCLDRDDVDERLWDAAQAAPGDHPYTREEFNATRAGAWSKAQAERPHVSGPADDFGPVAPELVQEPVGILAQFPRLNLAALLDPDRPPREWVLRGLLPAGASVSLVAPAGSMKSLLSLALSLAVARGDARFAELAIARQRRVMYVDAENTEDDLADRLRDLGVNPAELPELVYLHLPSLLPLDTAAGGAQLLAVCDAYELGRGDLVVLDSFQRVVEGAENDSDTYRAFYASTAAPLKKRGLTVLRTDNTGKDLGRGARGSSSKRDDVDIELLMTRDGESLRLAPGKVRISGIESLFLTCTVDDDGRLTFSSVGDPFRDAVAGASAALDDLDLPPDAGERKAVGALKEAGHEATRMAVRQAVRERKERAADYSESAPRGHGAPPGQDSPATAPDPNGAARRGEVETP